ncbi:MAG: tyrosinase family protein [Ardenticatenales bacterium]
MTIAPPADPRPARPTTSTRPDHSRRPRLLAAVALVLPVLLAGRRPALAQPAQGGLHAVTAQRAIVGTVFEDGDGDGIQAVGEAALSGRTVALVGPAGPLGTATSDSGGDFALGVGMAGTYTATLAVPVGWAATGASAVTVAFAEAPDAAAGLLGAPIRFGLRRTGTAAALAIDVSASTGCQAAGGAAAGHLASGLVGDEAIVRFAVRGAPTAWLTVLDVAPDGAVRSLADKRSVDGGQALAMAVPLGHTTGTRRILVRAYRAAADAAPAATGDCAFDIVAPDGPDITVQPDGLSFDRLGSGGKAERLLTIGNAGRAPLTIFDLDLQSDASVSPFSLPVPWSANTVLLPGEERGVTVRFAPQSDGAWQDFLLVRSDDPATPLRTVTLTGETTGVPRLSATVTTDRGCLAGDSGPLFIAGESIPLTLNVGAGGTESVQTVLEEIAPDGETILVASGASAPNQPWRRSVHARRALSAGAARLTASTGGGQRYAYGQCGWLVAAGVTDIAGAVEDVGGGAARPLAGARVTIDGPEAHAVLSGADGTFRVAVAQPGRYRVTVAPPDGMASVGSTEQAVLVTGFAGEVIDGLRFTAAVPDGAPTAVPTPPSGLPTLPGPSATPPPPTPIPSPTIPTTCQVTITPRTGTANVGQRVAFRAAVSPTRGAYTYQWGYEGDAIADYSESTSGPWRTTPIRAADMRSASFALYWKPAPSQRFPNNAGPIARRVWVTVRDGVGQCTESVTLNVERNQTSSTRQAEDFYTSNHTQFVLREHGLWHQRWAFDQPFYDGTLFFDFHVQFLDRFNRWRHEFGYPEIGIWDSAQPIPRGPDIDHASRNAIYRPYAKPLSFTANGGGGRGWNQLPCDVTGGGQFRLADFPADRRLLGCAVTEPWHNTVHLLIGGDMLNPPTAPRDPIFWRWHRWVDTVNRDRQRLQAGGLALGAGAPAKGGPAIDIRPVDGAAAASTAPSVVYETPFRLYPYVLSFDRFSVTFEGPIDRVDAAALTVNGSPAANVRGSGAGPYTFTGFATPPHGPIAVRLDRASAAPLAAASAPPLTWSYTLVRPDGDDDGDGLSNADEVTRTLTWPDDADSDDDGLDDGLEWRAGTFGLAADSDGDGAGDACEVRAGSDPLSAASRAVGCGTAYPFVCRSPVGIRGSGPTVR